MAMGSVLATCNSCGLKLPVPKKIETIYIKGYQYRVYNNGEYYEKFHHWAKYQCRECFFQCGAGEDKVFPTQEIRHDELRRKSKECDQEERKKRQFSQQQNQTKLQEKLKEMKLEVMMGKCDYKESEDIGLQISCAEGLSPLTKSSVITQNGGTVIIEGVELQFQPNSFKNGNSHTIQVTILPQKFYSGPANDYNAYSTVMVDIQPNNLTLEKPAKLKLPHCFQFKDAAKCNAQIFHSHHDEGEKPNWKDITESVSAVVTDSACEIELRSFCWIVARIFGQAELTRIRLYALAEPHYENSEFVTVIVGYHPAMSGEDEIYRHIRVNKLLGDYQSMNFSLRPQRNLHIAFDESYPNGWRLRGNMARNRVIPYEDIEQLNERHFPFTFCRDDIMQDLPELIFKVRQQGFLPFLSKHPYFLHIRIQICSARIPLKVSLY